MTQGPPGTEDWEQCPRSTWGLMAERGKWPQGPPGRTQNCWHGDCNVLPSLPLRKDSVPGSACPCSSTEYWVPGPLGQNTSTQVDSTTGSDRLTVRRLEAQGRVSAGLVSSEAPLLGLQAAALSLRPHRVSSLRPLPHSRLVSVSLL